VTSTTGRRFPLGQVVGTSAAQAVLSAHNVAPAHLLERHSRGDWGDLAEADRVANEQALAAGSFVLSAYRVGTQRVWVVTEPDQGTTTIMLPSEY
jgi:hypothetical protein